ncbi:uncharacterized protein LOC132603526 [Lycium barbarum]|uniref:uncharacterized protein LOC132603526 n=1 Tax=Lycium barbarum TaxID=112863 RepID=UPI00293E1222|nr:uncharacterized protein LOC132603526 [Lycium barbarum]
MLWGVLLCLKRCCNLSIAYGTLLKYLRVYLHDDRYYIFLFATKEDKEAVLEYGPYFFNSRPVILRDWEHEFQFQPELLRIVPLWVQLPRLPILYWADDNLSRIASCLGKSVCADQLTAQIGRVSYARVLIEMDITQPLPEVLIIEEADGVLRYQEVKYEWRPNVCYGCLKLGHCTKECLAKGDKETHEQAPPQPRRRKTRRRPSTPQWKPKVGGECSKQKEVTSEEIDTSLATDPVVNVPSASGVVNSDGAHPSVANTSEGPSPQTAQEVVAALLTGALQGPWQFGTVQDEMANRAKAPDLATTT